MRRNPWPTAVVVDVLVVLVFATIGRASHDESTGLHGVVRTAWPFLVGTVVAWALLTAARRPPAAITSGLLVWLGALLGGMALRQASGQGTATAFVVVATLVLGALLVLPRVGARARR